MHKGSQILCADGSIVLEVIETDLAAGIVTCKCQNNAKLGCAALRGLCTTTSAARSTFTFTDAVATATYADAAPGSALPLAGSAPRHSDEARSHHRGSLGCSRSQTRLAACVHRVFISGSYILPVVR